MEFIHPFIRDKKSWPHEPGVMYWKELPAALTVDEVIRNVPVREPCYG